MRKILFLIISFALFSCTDNSMYSGRLEKWKVSKVQLHGPSGNGTVYIQTPTETDFFFIHDYNIAQFREGDTITVLVKTVIPEDKK